MIKNTYLNMYPGNGVLQLEKLEEIHLSPVSSLQIWLRLILSQSLRRQSCLHIRNLKSVQSKRCERMSW